MKLSKAGLKVLRAALTGTVEVLEDIVDKGISEIEERKINRKFGLLIKVAVLLDEVENVIDEFNSSV
jgi:hypothetical protein